MHLILLLMDILLAGYPANPKTGYQISGMHGQILDIRSDIWLLFSWPVTGLDFPYSIWSSFSLSFPFWPFLCVLIPIAFPFPAPASSFLSLFFHLSSPFLSPSLLLTFSFLSSFFSYSPPLSFPLFLLSLDICTKE